MSRLDPSILQPIWPYQVNPASPQSVGLEFWMPMSAIPGSVGLHEQSFNKFRGITTGPANWITGFDGRAAIEYPPLSDSYTTFPAPDEPFLGPLTIIYWGSVYNLTSYRHFVSKHIGNGANSNPFDFRTDPFLNSGAIALVRANGGYAYWYSDVRPTVGRHQMFAVSAPAEIGTPPAFYVDAIRGGIYLWNVGSGTAGGVGEPIWLGRRGDGVTATDGYTSEVRIYSRQLSDSEILDQYYNRFDLYWMPWYGGGKVGSIFDIGAAFNARANIIADVGAFRTIGVTVNGRASSSILFSPPIQRTQLRLFQVPAAPRVYVMPPAESRVFEVPASDRIFGSGEDGE